MRMKIIPYRVLYKFQCYECKKDLVIEIDVVKRSFQIIANVICSDCKCFHFKNHLYMKYYKSIKICIDSLEKRINKMDKSTAEHIKHNNRECVEDCYWCNLELEEGTMKNKQTGELIQANLREAIARHFDNEATRIKPHHPISDTVKESLRRYAVDRIETGSFLRAVLENDLKGAMVRADLDNRRDLYNIVVWVMNTIPAISQGSPKLVSEWLE